MLTPAFYPWHVSLVQPPAAAPSVKGHPVNTTVIQIHALTSAADEENVEEFYGKLQELLEHVKMFYLLWESRMQKKNGEAGAPGIAGKCRLVIQNEPGEKML